MSEKKGGAGGGGGGGGGGGAGGLLGWVDGIDRALSAAVYDPNWRLVCKVRMFKIAAHTEHRPQCHLLTLWLPAPPRVSSRCGASKANQQRRKLAPAQIRILSCHLSASGNGAVFHGVYGVACAATDPTLCQTLKRPRNGGGCARHIHV